MRIKFILALLITLFTLQFTNAQTNNGRVSAFEVIHLVTDANLKLNRIYRERVQGHEEEQLSLRKAIYAANTELWSIHSMFSGSNMIKDYKHTKIQKHMDELQAAIDAVCLSVESAELRKRICMVEIKAKVLKKMVAKIRE